MPPDDVEPFIAAFVQRAASTHPIERVLDAGAGRRLPFPLPPGARVTGLDVSEASLAGNESLDEQIVGDLQTHPLPADDFDVIVCWNVLEHVPRPLAALANLHSTLRPGGLLIVSIPNLESPKTLVTKFTPHRFHVWIYRSVLGQSDAGHPGYAPFRTYLHRDLAPRRLRRKLEQLGFEIESEIRYSSGMVSAIVARNALLRLGWATVGVLWRLARRDPELSDVAWILRKPEPVAARNAA